MHGRLRLATTILAWNFIGSVLAVLFNLTFHPRSSPHFLHSFVYANVIGTLVALGVVSLAPRLARVRFPLDCALLTAFAVAISAIGTAIAAAILIAAGSFAPNLAWLAPHRMGLGLLLGVIFAAALYGYESLRLRHVRAERLAAEASLSSLESRIRPHFLFNTLNSISALIHDDPAAAERMVERLAALLRFSLDSTERSTIPLETELRIAADYLDLEKARFGERLHYAIEVPSELQSLRVPPFVVQTLVENSVKHAVAATRRGGAIHVAAFADGARATISVRDDGNGFTGDAFVAGHGLDNLRSRLDVLFGAEAQLRVARIDQQTVVSATFPVHG